MKKYEVGFILNPQLDEATTLSTVETLKNLYAEGTIIDELDLGLKELAYEIEKNKTGYYYFLVVEANHEMNQEFERICRLSESVIRFMVIDINDIKGSTLDTLRK